MQGAGAGVTIINANAIDRVFQIIGNVNVVLKNLSITGGLATDGGSIGGADALGGGILNNGGTLTLDHVVVVTNVAQANPGQNALGGGIYSNGRSLTISDSSILNNKALGGAGIDGVDGAGGTGGDGRGGGIYNASGTLTILRSTIAGNAAKGGPGGHGGKGNTQTAGTVPTGGGPAPTGGGPAPTSGGPAPTSGGPAPTGGPVPTVVARHRQTVGQRRQVARLQIFRGGSCYPTRSPQLLCCPQPPDATTAPAVHATTNKSDRVLPAISHFPHTDQSPLAFRAGASCFQEQCSSRSP
jgi:hypothetical protein